MQLDLFENLSELPTQNSVRVDGDFSITSPRGKDVDEPPAPILPINLAEAVALYDDASSDHPRRANIRSAFRTIGRVLNQPLSEIAAEPARLQRLLGLANPARAALKPRTWIQVKSVALHGLRALGVDVVPGRDATPLSLVWEALESQLPERRLKIGLSRLLRFFSRTQVTPEAVDLAAFEAFRLELSTRSLHPKSKAAYRQAIQHWNEAASVMPIWPQLRVAQPADPRRYSFEWGEFPASFLAEVDAFLAAKQGSDPLAGDDYSRPVRGQTTKSRRKMFRQFASALVHSGQVAMEDITDFSVLTDLENVRAALRYLRDRREVPKITEGDLNSVWLLRTVARYWLKDEHVTQALRKLIASLSDHRGTRRQLGMTDRNRELLRQFDNPANFDALVALPHQILRRHGRNARPRNRDSVRVMYALQIGLLTFVPIRSKNLVELKLGVNLIDQGRGPNRRVRIYLPASTTKTERDYEAPVPAYLWPLLDAWLNCHRSQICPFESAYLFPSPSGTLRSRDGLASKLIRFVKRETGLNMTLHSFRHLAAKRYLEHNPDGIEVVRQLLGHTSTRVTLRAYAELQTDPAFRRYEEAVLAAQDKLTGRRRLARAGRGRA